MVKIMKVSQKRTAESPLSLSSFHAHTPPTHYRSSIIKVSIPVLLLTVLAVSSCYTQFHPPTPTRPPVANTPDSLQQHSSADTVYHIYQEPDPFAPYYYRRYNRWNHYYNTPWWYGSRYYNNYYYHPYRTTPYQYVPSGGSTGTSPPAEKKPVNRGRKLQLTTPAPAEKTSPAKTDDDGDDNESSGSSSADEPEKETRSNRGRKLDF